MHFDYIQRKQKGFLIIWILVGVLVGGVILFTAIKLKPQPTPSPQSIVTPTPNPVEETVNWKMYTNTKDGYSIKYPNGAKLTEGGSYSSDGVFVADANRVSMLVDVEKNESDQLGGLGNFIVAITTEDNKKGLVLDDFKKEFDGISEDLDIEGKRIEKGLLDGRTYITGAAGGVRGMTQIILIEKGKIYKITFEPKLSVTGDMILSTFKFTNQIDTADWKTYTNNAGKFRIQYPPEWMEDYKTSSHGRLVLLTMDSCQECGGMKGGMYIYLLDNKKKLTAKDYLMSIVIPAQQGCGNIKIVPDQPASFGGLDVVMANGFCGAGSPGLDVYIAQESNIIELRSDGLDDDITNKILSTFKFTNKIDITNWKTYESRQFEFSIKYPPELGVNDGAAKNTITIGKGYETQAEAPGWPSFMYISTIPDGFTGRCGEIYVYCPQVAKALLNMQLGETNQSFPFKRLPDITIDGVSAKVFDKLIPDKRKIERELYPYKGGNTYMIGVIISSEDSSMTLEKFNQILSTFKFL